MEIANEQMAAAWDGDEGAGWAENAERYEASRRYFGVRLFAKVAPADGDHVLEIGCGTGALTRQLARAAPNGSVLGVDLSSPMLEHARHRARDEGLSNVDLIRADAQVHPFAPGEFDLAVSEFGSMFFEDPVAAFTNIRRALRAGGRLVLATWRPFEENVWLATIFRALAAGSAVPTPPTGQPGPFGLADEGTVRRILTEAGFTDIEMTPVDAPMWLGKDVDDAWEFVSVMGPVRGLTAGLDPDVARDALAGLRRDVAACATPDGVAMGAAEWIITASA